MKPWTALPGDTDDPRADPIAMRTLVAGELDGIRLALEEIGVSLCTDPSVAKRHFTLLQSIDELCQRHENLAAMLRAPDMDVALAAITLASLRNRLSKAVSGGFHDITG